MIAAEYVSTVVIEMRSPLDALTAITLAPSCAPLILFSQTAVSTTVFA
jgi:hypothetical protein